MVGGSVASSVYGLSRPTMDIDIVVDLDPDKVADFVAQLSAGFYLDEEAIRNAIRSGRAFNVIHFESTFKFDLFPLRRTDPFQRSEFSRRTHQESRQFGEPIEFSVASAEDAILAKLQWYRLGGETSEKQWRDIEGIVQVRGKSLDREYLQQWAEHLGVSALLWRLLP